MRNALTKRITWALLAGGIAVAALFCLTLFENPAHAARSRPVNSTEIRKAQRDVRRQYGADYYMYGAIRQGQRYYRKGNRYYRVPGR